MPDIILILSSWTIAGILVRYSWLCWNNNYFVYYGIL